MKKIILTFALLFSISFAFAQLTVTISNISPLKGTVRIALFNSAKTYMDLPLAYKKVMIPAGKNEISHTYENIPNGTYSIAVYLDENDNNILNKNFFGVPTEKYGFSNNIRGVLSMPTYAETKFTFLNEKLIKITIK